MASYFVPNIFFCLNTFSGADLRIKTAMLFTPLLAAIRYSQPGTVALLLEKRADMMVMDSIKQYNPIMWAVEMEKPEILKVKLTCKYITLPGVLLYNYIFPLGAVTSWSCVTRRTS